MSGQNSSHEVVVTKRAQKSGEKKAAPEVRTVREVPAGTFVPPYEGNRIQRVNFGKKEPHIKVGVR